MSEHCKRSAFKVGDEVWFVANNARPIYMYKDIGEDICPNAHSPMNLVPIPVKGVIQSIYIHQSIYSPSSECYAPAGGYRISEKGLYGKYTETETLEYEIRCIFSKSLKVDFLNTSIREMNDHLRTEPDENCFYNGLYGVPEELVGTSPEEAELRHNEKQYVVSSVISKAKKEGYTSLLQKDLIYRFLSCLYASQFLNGNNTHTYKLHNLIGAVNAGKMYLNVSKNLYNIKNFSGFSDWLDVLRDSKYSEQLILYKWMLVFEYNK